MPSTASVLVAHTPSLATTAATLAQDLQALGLRAEALSFGRSSRPARMLTASATKVIVLWSDDAGQRMRSFAAQAHKRKALILLRADASTPPIGIGPSLKLPRGRSTSDAWRRILEIEPMPDEFGATRTTRGAAVLALLMMALVPAVASYYADAAFAARIDMWASQARALATGLMGG